MCTLYYNRFSSEPSELKEANERKLSPSEFKGSTGNNIVSFRFLVKDCEVETLKSIPRDFINT